MPSVRYAATVQGHHHGLRRDQTQVRPLPCSSSPSLGGADDDRRPAIAGFRAYGVVTEDPCCSWDVAPPPRPALSHISEVTGIPCQSNEFVQELLRGVRLHLGRFIRELKDTLHTTPIPSPSVGGPSEQIAYLSLWGREHIVSTTVASVLKVLDPKDYNFLCSMR